MFYRILFSNLQSRKNIKGKKNMDQEMTIKGLAEQQVIVINYSDDDIIIIDNVKQLVEANPTRIHMNLIAIAKHGKAQMLVNGQTTTVGENQLLLCPPNTVLTDLMFSPDFEFKAMFLTNRIIQSFLREKMNIWNNIMYVHKMRVVTLNPRDIEFFYSFSNTLKMVIDAPDDYYPYRAEVIQGLLRGVILGFSGALKTMLPEGQKEDKKSHSDTLFQQFLDLVNKDQSKAHTVEAYASKLCISPKYLSVICKKNSGKTANEWIREHMLEEIRYYLKQTDLAIKQISDQLGFANPSFFGKYVKEHFGMTPMQLRVKK